MSFSNPSSSEPWQVLTQGSSWPTGWTSTPSYKNEVKGEMKSMLNKAPTVELSPNGLWNTTWTPNPPAPIKKKTTSASSSPSTSVLSQETVQLVSQFAELTFSAASNGNAWNPQLPNTLTKKKQSAIDPVATTPAHPVIIPSETSTHSLHLGTTDSDHSEEDKSNNIEEELSKQSLYKTELCRSFNETGTCRYGHKCQFAHGEHELRPILRHPKYKTENCKTFVATGTCPYGPRCRFIHPVVANPTRPTQKWTNSWNKTEETGDDVKNSRLTVYLKDTF